MHPCLRVTIAVVLSIIAAVLVIGQGVVLLVYGEITSFLTLQSATKPTFTFGLSIGLIGIFGIIVGVCILAGMYLMSSPGLKDIGAIVVLIFSLLSIVAGGGWFVGIALGVLAGMLGLYRK